MNMELKTIEKLIDHQKICFISYIDEEGYPHTKAMLQPRKREGLEVFYLSTNTSSNKVKFLKDNNKASLYFVDKRFFRGVNLIGTVEVLEDQLSKDMIWEKGDTLYYKEGVTDPDYCVLKFTMKKGRYYSSFKSINF